MQALRFPTLLRCLSHWEPTVEALVPQVELVVGSTTYYHILQDLRGPKI